MKKKIKESNNVLPNTIKIGYTDYQFELWPDTFASTEKAQGEFFMFASHDDPYKLPPFCILAHMGLRTFQNVLTNK